MTIYFHKLQQYSTLIKFWQTKFNLISNSTIANMWERHFLDSIQLLKFININSSAPKTIFDLGAGAGFPSVALAIIDTNNTYYAVEANSKKCVFLHHVKRELQLDNLIIANIRIEDFIKENKKADIILARALTNLNKLLFYSKQLLSEEGYCVFLKGISYKEEISSLTKEANELFLYKIYNNIFNDSGKVLLFSLKN